MVTRMSWVYSWNQVDEDNEVEGPMCYEWRPTDQRQKVLFGWLFGTPDHTGWLFGTLYISPNDCHSQCDHCFPSFRLRSTHHQMFFNHKLIWTNFDNFDRVTVRFGQLSRYIFYHNAFVKPIVVTWVKEQRFQSLSNQLWWNHQFESSHSTIRGGMVLSHFNL